jgi:hypothetical protein
MDKLKLDWRSLSPRSRALLLGALGVHLSLLLSWRLGFWNGFTFDSVATQGRRGWDFYALYQAGRNALDGVSVYQSDNDKINVVVPLYTPYRYLPLPALSLGVLLNALPPLWAYRLWVAVVEAVLLGCILALWRRAGDPALAARLAALWLCYTPYYLELYLGQFSLLQGALVLVMLLATLAPPLGWRYDLAWTLSLLWKQNSGLFLPVYLRQRRWRGLLVAGGIVLATSLPYFALTPGTLSAFLGNFQSAPLAPNLGNLGVRQALYSALSALSPALGAAAHEGAQRLWVGGVMAVGVWLTWRARPIDPLLALCLWTTSFFLLYHQVWEHHYVLLLPVLSVLTLRTRARGVLLLGFWLAMWTPYILLDPHGLAAYHAPLRWTPLSPPLLDVLYHASKAAPTLALWGYLAALMLRRAATAQAG